MRIAAAQIVTGPDTHENLRQVERWTELAAAEGARVVVFPEATQRAFGHPLTPIAEPTHGPWASAVKEIAELNGVTVVAGMFTPASPSEEDRDRVTNTLIAVGGGVHASYDKVHLYDAFGFKESKTVQAGDEIVQFEVDGVKLGLATCYDIRFPNLFTDHARAGAVATLLSASWGAGPGKVEQWELLARARALDSTQYIVACGQGLPSAAGVEPAAKAPTGVGHSMVVAPSGKVIAQAGESPQLLTADLDPDTVERTQRLIPVLANAREL